MHIGLEFDEIEQELEVKKAARGAYLWSRWLSIISVPWFLSLLTDLYRASFSDYLKVAALPAIPHVFMIGLIMTSNILFVRKHAQQALILVGFRIIFAFMVAVIVWNGSESFAALLFLAGNGGLWWFGNRWGLRQVAGGECWLMQKQGQSDQLTMSDLDVKSLEKELRTMRKEKPQKRMQPKVGESRAEHKTQDRQSADTGAESRSVDALVEVFLHGDQASRRNAIRELEALGQVEVF